MILTAVDKFLRITFSKRKTMTDTYRSLEKRSNSKKSFNRGNSFVAEKSIKCGRNLFYLSILQLLLSVLILAFGCSCFSINHIMISGSKKKGIGCNYGSGIWVGVLCVLHAFLGLAALRNKDNVRRRLVFTYFVFSVLSLMPSALLTIMSIIWASRNALEINYKPWPVGTDEESKAQLGLALNICLATVAMSERKFPFY